MRFMLLAVISCGAGLFAQTAAVGIPPSPHLASSSGASRSRPAIAVPTLGFVIASDDSGLIPMRGLAAAPSTGEVLPKPQGVGRIFLPPREHYALVEQASPASVAVWHLATRRADATQEILDPVGGVSGGADLVAFSSTGKAAAFYYAASAKVQVITGLPGMPAVQPALSMRSLSSFTTLLVSDDGQVVAGIGPDSIALSSYGSAFRAMPWTYSPRTAAFVSNSHSLLISDTRQKQLVLIQNVDAQSSAPLIIGSNLVPDHLAICSHGDSIIALDSIQQKLWQIDSASLTVSSVPLTQRADVLLTLRDGHTFLLSMSPLYVVKIGDGPVSDSLTGALHSSNQ